MRAGELTQARLEAAADFGSEAATIALGREGRVASLVDALLALSPRERVGFAGDCAERAIHLWASFRADDRRPQELLGLVREWADGHGDEDAIHAQAEEVWGCQNPHEIDPPTRAARAAYWLGTAVNADDEAQAEACAEVVERVVHALSEAAWEESYANGEMVADLKQSHTANVERSWQRSRLCRYLVG